MVHYFILDFNWEQNLDWSNTGVGNWIDFIILLIAIIVMGPEHKCRKSTFSVSCCVVCLFEDSL
jgi:hypothetical protein